MRMIKKWWRALPRGRRNVSIVMMVLFALVLIAAIFGWIRSLTAEAQVATSASSSEERPAEESGESKNPDKKVKVKQDGYEFDVDENGMAVMPVTTDPREAAAGAAAVAFTADFSKLDRQEYVDAAIARMTHPSEKYVGPEGEIHTLVEARPFEEIQRHYLPPDHVLKLQADSWSLRDNPENYSWWTLLNGTTYENFALLPDHFWLAHPQTVVGEEEIAKIDPSLVPSFPAGTDMEPDTAGASLTHWWVLSDVDNSKMGTAAATTMHPAYFAIWCDAPKDGGLCGVAYTLEAQFPEIWPRQ
ncbi:hypothetical protein ACFWHR_12140 [Leucobacter sp. NPDC058333]|uniref:hypothetical protein n=1 Tax=Leucobacter sp. NPDC058333 TaxID=3346450 RepID=UPI0036529AED